MTAPGVPDGPHPAPSRRDHRWSDGEIAALVAPIFGVPADDLAFVIVVQTADGQCDGISNLADAEETAGFLREAIGMLPADSDA